MSDELQDILEQYRAMKEQRDELLGACETALGYIEAVCFNTPNPKKRKNYADCASILRAAISKATGEPPCAA